MLKIAIATTSTEKIKGIQEAFIRYLNIEESEIEFYSTQVESGVPDQPIGEETYQGALNRVNKIKENFSGMDFYVSCEAGIENTFNKYFNVQVVCIFETKSQKFLWGKSSGWLIPSKDIKTIAEISIDTYLRKKGISSIDQLLGKSYSRKLFVFQATELALASKKLLD